MTVLIIGKQGFIAKNLTKYLKKRKVKVKNISYAYESMIDNSKELFRNEHQLLNILKGDRYDYIINCSGSSNVYDSMQNPNHDFQANTSLVNVILDSVVKSEQRIKFINLSSAAVYGECEDKLVESLPFENLHPITAYGTNKLITEILLKHYSILYKIPVISLRIFSCYGNGQNKLLFYDIIQKYIQDKIVRLYGTGEESRDFIHVSDLCQIIYLLTKNYQNQIYFNEIYNAGNGEGITIKQIGNYFSNHIKDLTIKFNNKAHKGAPSIYIADHSKLKALGYKQKFTIERGIEEYIKWIKRQSGSF